MSERSGSKISNWVKIGLIGLIVILITGVSIYKHNETHYQGSEMETQAQGSKHLPMLIDLGAGYCVPCTQMVPVLEAIKKDFAGRLIVKVIDVSKNPDEANKYGIQLIPTQIIFDANGKEVDRNEGYIPKEDLVKALAKAGVK
jgi:thioredoxin 1